MDRRYGAWAQLLTLFRLVHDGGRHGGLKLPARKGYLFDPDRYPFLEGRPQGSRRQPGERAEPPHVSDGVVFRVLRNLLILDGERLSYRTLDVEQIGSVYEAIMGFHLEVAKGRSIAIKPKKAARRPDDDQPRGPALGPSPNDRAKWLKDQTDQAVTGQALDRAEGGDHARGRRRGPGEEGRPRGDPAHRAAGGDGPPAERRAPQVRLALHPAFAHRADRPDHVPARSWSGSASRRRPEQILDLKVCDPAMGSGAFLVEACRQLGDELVKAWHAHDCVPPIPPDEDELLHARRIVAQRCLYGVDRNPMAVDLAKLSLWLATLAKDHPFTFLDHALRHGDSLVGLSQGPDRRLPLEAREAARLRRGSRIEDRINRAIESRREIREAADATPESLLTPEARPGRRGPRTRSGSTATS